MRERFLQCVQANPVNRAIIERGAKLGVEDWWLTAGALFQTVWNVLDGRDPQAGIRDYDVFYFDADTSWEAENDVIERAADLFADLGAPVEVRNEARVHLWYEAHFGVPAAPFSSCRDAIDHFASTTCCFGATAGWELYAPYGYDDVLAQIVRPNPVLAPRAVYEAKATRWLSEWPGLTVVPWPQE